MNRFCRVFSGFLWLEQLSSQKGVEFQLQTILRYSDTNALIISDFVDVYHEPMAISFLLSLVCCQLC